MFQGRDAKIVKLEKELKRLYHLEHNIKDDINGFAHLQSLEKDGSCKEDAEAYLKRLSRQKADLIDQIEKLRADRYYKVRYFRHFYRR